MKTEAVVESLDSETAKLHSIFRPQSIAVIGASARLDSIGGRILHNLVDFGFQGKVFPVNPKAGVLHSMKCYATVEEIPDPVDLAIVVVKREAVLEVVEACGRKGVGGVIVITAGFREVGGEGVELERQLVGIVKRYGMRMIGPNCFGVLNTNPEVGMDATFGKHHPRKGRIAFMSQSGALGQVIMEYALRYGVGFSMMASVGNKANVSGNDLLMYWQDDPETDIILLYLESFGNPRRFSQITRRLSRRKPIVAVKSGRTAAGAKATVSHTGALAGLDIAVEALFQQCGIMRVSTVEELFDLTVALANQPIPRGNRVAIMTNAGGPAVMATDAVIGEGLRMAELGEETRARARALLPPAASVANPVDMLASGSPEQYHDIMELLLADPGVDALLVIYVPPLMVDTAAVLRNVAAVAEKSEKTILGCIMGAEEEKYSAGNFIPGPRIPAYRFPESAIRSLAQMERYGRWLDRDEGTIPEFAVDRARVASILREVRARGDRQITGGEALGVLEACGVPTAPHRLALGEMEAVERAVEIGFPVALKVASSAVLHKTELGGVMLDLRTAEEVQRAWQEMDRRMRAHLGASAPTPVMIQKMIRGGVETVMGMSTDPAFGPLLMFGIGGIHVELLKDVTFRVLPISDRDAHEMIEGLRGFRLLAGYRGSPPVDRAVLEECLLRLSQLTRDFHEITEFDVNPFIAMPGRGASSALDARILLAVP